MLLDLSKMRGSRDHLERTYQPAAFDPVEDYRIVDAVRMTVDVYKKNTDVTLTGRVATVLELQCSRCLEPFRLPLDAAFDLLYLPHGANAGEGEVEIEEDDLDTAFYREDAIDLGHLMSEQFYLALPMKPLCIDACKGLCPQCGNNLNVSTCACTNDWVDPRLEALRALMEPDGK